jgi:predicted nuclease with TOPRIM domain
MTEHARASWSDDRLDDLSGRVSHLETRMDTRFNQVEARIDQRFDALQNSIGALQNAMIITLAGILASFGGLLVATHL